MYNGWRLGEKRSLEKEKKKMSRKGKIQNVTDGILSSFISRNNSINGYWGIGKICGYLFESNEDKLKINLRSKEANIYKEEMKFMIDFFSDKFYRNLKMLSISNKMIKNVSFEVFPLGAINDVDKNELKVAIYVKCESYDITFSKVVSCYNHRARKEQRSLRDYEL
jgi:hypothetical protein